MNFALQVLIALLPSIVVGVLAELEYRRLPQENPTDPYVKLVSRAVIVILFFLNAIWIAVAFPGGEQIPMAYRLVGGLVVFFALSTPAASCVARLKSARLSRA